MEIWKKCYYFEDYEVSNYGRVKRKTAGQGAQAGRMRKLRKDSKGYFYLRICKNSKIYNKNVHTLVLEAFVCPRPKGLECLHMDGDITNNKLSNLKWGTHKENMAQRGETRGGNKIDIVRKLNGDGASKKSIAETLNISEGTVHNYLNHKWVKRYYPSFKEK